MAVLFKFTNEKVSVLLETAILVAGIAVFALFIQKDGYLMAVAFGGLLLASGIIATIIVKTDSSLELLGMDRFNKKILWYGIAAVLIGTIPAFCGRYVYDLTDFPQSLTIIALISPLIGITEEIIFRGYMQGRLRVIGVVGCVSIPAAAHSVYKFLVLLSVNDLVEVNYPYLILLTFGFGVIVGLMRAGSGSLVACIVRRAHVWRLFLNARLGMGINAWRNCLEQIASGIVMFDNRKLNIIFVHVKRFTPRIPKELFS